MAVPGYMSSEQKTLRKRIIGLVIAVVLIAAFVLIPPFEGLTEEGMASIGIFIGAIVLFVAQVAPLAVSCLTLMVLLPFFNITTLTQIWADFGGTSFFFVFFCFGVTGARPRPPSPCAFRRGSPGCPRATPVCWCSGSPSRCAPCRAFCPTSPP